MNKIDGDSAPRRICLCDSETSYGEHLMEYLRSEGKLPCEVYLYTSRESFLRMETPATTRLLVIAESQYSAEIENAGFKDILLLNESSVYMEKPENMSKYQSVDRICDRIREICAGQSEEASPGVRHGKPATATGTVLPRGQGSRRSRNRGRRARVRRSRRAPSGLTCGP